MEHPLWRPKWLFKIACQNRPTAHGQTEKLWLNPQNMAIPWNKVLTGFWELKFSLTPSTGWASPEARDKEYQIRGRGHRDVWEVNRTWKLHRKHDKHALSNVFCLNSTCTCTLHVHQATHQIMCCPPCFSLQNWEALILVAHLFASFHEKYKPLLERNVVTASSGWHYRLDRKGKLRALQHWHSSSATLLTHPGKDLLRSWHEYAVDAAAFCHRYIGTTL